MTRENLWTTGQRRELKITISLCQLPSTEGKRRNVAGPLTGDDRGKKFEHYRSIDSLAEYLLVSQTEPHVEQFLRQEDGIWLFKAFAGRDARMPLPSLGCEIALAEIYDKVDL